MELFLHIGWHKTGTTSIQSFCSSHREALLREGTFYPDLGTGSSHPALALDLAPRRSAVLADLWPAQRLALESALASETAFAELARQIDAIQPQTVVLSSECFLEWVDPTLVMNKFDEYLGIRPTVLCFGRDPVSWLLSAYSDLVSDPEIRYAGELSEMPQLEIADLPLMLSHWKEADPKRLLVVPPSSPGTRVDNLPKFLKSIGLPPEFAIGRASNRLNQSLSLEQIEILRTMNLARVPTSQFVDVVSQMQLIRSAEASGTKNPGHEVTSVEEAVRLAQLLTEEIRRAQDVGRDAKT